MASTTNRPPVIAIVGRPNVGKSSLLNALTGKRISIVQDQPGVTRDRISVHREIDGHWVELVDTGGYGFVDPDQLTEHIAHQIELAMARADLVLFIVDAETGLTGADEEITALLRRKNIRAVLVANKADGPKADAMLADFAGLGFGTPIGVSALRERNIDQVVDAIRSRINLDAAPTEMPAPQMMLAIVGKRNAGKSTLVNSIAKIYEGDGDRVIVSEVPGTTRDSIDVRFEKEGKTLIVIDTAGVRKKRHMVTNDIEFYSFHRAQRSVRRADVVLLLIDATQPISEPDKKLAQYVAEQYKPVILVVNKWDLALKQLRDRRKEEGEGTGEQSDSKVMEEYRTYLDAELKHLSFAPIAFTTAKDGRNVRELIDLSQHLFKQVNLRVSTSKLNEAFEQIVAERMPSFPGGRRPKIFYATMTAVAPPTIVMFVNAPEYVDESYRRFVVNRLRELLPYDEVPVRLEIRGRSGRQTAAGKSIEEGPKGPAAHRPRGGKLGKRSRSGPKPRPKKAGLRGPQRGRRPH